MEKQARHIEWAKFKLIGRPLITCKALGPSSLLWVACRTSPCLVHIYQDAQLRALLRFPEDPIFLLFGPLQEDTIELNQKICLKCEPDSASLLVITLDGCIWSTPLVDSCVWSDRPPKRLKQKPSGKVDNAVPKTVGSRPNADAMSDSWQMPIRDTGDVWDIFQDTEIYKDSDFYLQGANDAKSEAPCGSPKDGFLYRKLLKLQCLQDTSVKLQAVDVRAEFLIGKCLGASLGAFGPQNLIAVSSASPSPTLFKSTLSRSLLPSAGHCTSETGLSEKTSKSTCLLFATSMEAGKDRALWGGACLSQKFFNALSRKFKNIRVQHLLLQGNMAGQVHVFPVDYPNQTCTSTIFCDLQEPIAGLLGVTFDKENDVLLVIGKNGRLVAVTTTEEDSASSPFVNAPSGPSSVKLFYIDLKDGFIIHDWNVRQPVISPTMAGSRHLCFCCGTKVCVVDLFENAGDGPSHSSRHKNLASAKPSAKFQGMALNKSLVLKGVKIADIVIALVGNGPFSLATSTRPLVALTSRGRLLALEVSEHVLTTDVDGYMMRQQGRTWKSEPQKREDCVKELIQEIAKVETCSEALQIQINSINCALSELAFALKLAYDVLRNRDRVVLHASHLPLAASSLDGLLCNLEVKPMASNVSAEWFHFGHGSNISPFKSHRAFVDSDYGLVLCIHVTLFNHSLWPISQYWTLLVQFSNSDITETTNSMSFSSIINDGYGLAPGAKCTIDFQVQPERCQSPLVASIFLCHSHENHDEVVNKSLRHGICAADGHRTKMNFVKRTRQFMQDSHDDEVRGKGTRVLRATPGVVCLLLARYRLDVLSFMTPPRKSHHASHIRLPITSSSLLHRQQDIDQVVELLGPFSGKLQLRFTKDVDTPLWMALNAMQKWQACFLEDLVEHGTLSKNGDQLTLCDPKGGTVSLYLYSNMTKRKGLSCREIRFSASSLLLACTIRESILWRFSKFKDQSSIDHERTTEKCQLGVKEIGIILLENWREMLNVIKEAEKRLEDVCDREAIVNLGKITPEPSDMIPQASKEADGIFKGLVENYRRYRESAASDPFLILYS